MLVRLVKCDMLSDMESKEARQALEQLDKDVAAGAHQPSRAVAGLLAAVYGGVLLAGGWQQWWWMAGLLLALGAALWIFRSRVMDTRTHNRRQEPPRWHWSQYFPLWLPVIPLVARLSEWWAVAVALAGAAHLYWFLARGGWR